jgi:hypothetical protein
MEIHPDYKHCFLQIHLIRLLSLKYIRGIFTIYTGGTSPPPPSATCPAFPPAASCHAGTRGRPGKYGDPLGDPDGGASVPIKLTAFMGSAVTLVLAVLFVLDTLVLGPDTEGEEAIVPGV